MARTGGFDAYSLENAVVRDILIFLGGRPGPYGTPCMTIEELKAEIADILGVAKEQIQPDTGSATLAEWDSMATLRIISLLDEAGDEPLEADESAGLTSFQAVVDLARKRGLLDQ